ncbi:MAG: hypothetical protein ACRD0C_05485 [Acidimicrobiia bacterium]
MRKRLNLLAAGAMAGAVLAGLTADPAGAAQSWERYEGDCTTVDKDAFTRLVCWQTDRLTGDNSAEWDF